MRAVLVSFLFAALAACSALVPKLEKPSLSIVNVEFLKTDMFEQRLKVRIHVQNPNERALPVKGLSYALEVAGEPFAQGISDGSFVVPAMGEAEFDMNVTANMAATLMKLMSRSGGIGDQVDYRMKGKIALSAGLLRSIPFEEHGTFKLR